MSKLVKLLLGFCAHDRYTFPISLKPGQPGPEAARVTGIYVVCLDCGKEFAYSWEEMRMVSGPSRDKPHPTGIRHADLTSVPPTDSVSLPPRACSFPEPVPRLPFVGQ
jgi:hypothetical protein